jgi:hypothetical protein
MQLKVLSKTSIMSMKCRRVPIEVTRKLMEGVRVPIEVMRVPLEAGHYRSVCG